MDRRLASSCHGAKHEPTQALGNPEVLKLGMATVDLKTDVRKKILDPEDIAGLCAALSLRNTEDLKVHPRTAPAV